MTQLIALIGLGGIATKVIEELSDLTEARIIQVLVRPGRAKMTDKLLPTGIQAIERIDELMPEVSLVIETAGHSAVAEYGSAVLSQGKDFGLISSGALADKQILATLLEAAKQHHRRILVFNGAVAALDAVCSARTAGLESLCYTGVKPVQAWEGTPAATQFDLHALSEPTIIFEGTAREVALAYPKNANVAATLALAGLGMDKTLVRLVADPSAQVNRHHVIGSGVLGKFQFDIESQPLASNPKTSGSTAYSIISHLQGGPNALILS